MYARRPHRRLAIITLREKKAVLSVDADATYCTARAF